MKSINHKNTRFLRGNPVTGEKTTKASLTSKIYFARIQLWLGHQPLTIYLTANKDSYDTIYFPVSLGGAPAPYNPIV